ncbi:MAG: hypothetical protein ABJN42_10040 [Roseibium sp.]|uniref:hypothetical protein n=1 Tax=Roseibium sp. TaxID=1936156 RepID=UPI00329934E3
MWENIGDVNPKQGTTLINPASAEISRNGDFQVEAITVTPESQIGGSDSAFTLRRGDIFLSSDNFISALEAIGADLQGERIVMENSDSAPLLESPEGLMIMASAAQAYVGIEDPDIDSLVQIGLPDRMDQDPKFDGEVTFYPEGSSIWSIMEEHLGAFEHPELEKAAPATAYNTFDGPMEGMPRQINDRSDLMQIAGFRSLDTDEAGNPKVFRNLYVEEDVDGMTNDSWSNEMTTADADDCFDGKEISPVSSEWIGPAEPELIALWEGLEPSTKAPDDAVDLSM